MFENEPPTLDEVLAVLQPLALGTDTVHFHDPRGRYAFAARASDELILNCHGMLVRSTSSRERLNLSGSLSDILENLDDFPGVESLPLGPFYIDLGRNLRHTRATTFADPDARAATFAELSRHPGYRIVDKHVHVCAESLEELAAVVTSILAKQ